MYHDETFVTTQGAGGLMRKTFLWIYVILSGLLFSEKVIAQKLEPQAQYLSNTREGLQMRVHIWGEVNKPGEYLVDDNTNVLELISKAGGPTDFANLSNVTLTRTWLSPGRHHNGNSKSQLKEKAAARILIINLKKYLGNRDSYIKIPILLPGDVVTVNRNMWYSWNNIVQIARDLAIIASVYFWYRRAANE